MLRSIIKNRFGELDRPRSMLNTKKQERTDKKINSCRQNENLAKTKTKTLSEAKDRANIVQWIKIDEEEQTRQYKVKVLHLFI